MITAKVSKRERPYRISAEGREVIARLLAEDTEFLVSNLAPGDRVGLTVAFGEIGVVRVDLPGEMLEEVDL